MLANFGWSELLVFYVGSIFIVVRVAAAKSLNVSLWAFLVLCFGPFAALAVLFVPSARPKRRA